MQLMLAMILWCLVTLLTIQTVCSTPWDLDIQHAAADIVINDFDEHAREYVLKVGRDVNRKVLWWDMYGTNQHLRENPEYHKYKIRIDSDNLRYGDVKRQVDRPQTMYTAWFHNSQASQVLKTQFSRELRHTSTFTWNVAKGLKTRNETKSPVELPGGMEGTKTNSSEISLMEEKGQTTTETDTFKIAYDLLVEPKTSVKAEWRIIEREVEVEWKADVHIQGWVAMWFEEQYDGHYLWFHPISFLANDVFVWEGNGLVFTATGSFKGVRGIDSIVRTEELPLQPDN